MAKVNFTKVEKAFDDAIQKLSIDTLSDLASLASAIQNPDSGIKSPQLAETIARFQKELRKLKKHDLKLYEKLELSPEEESRLSIETKEYLKSDWIMLKRLKEKIDALKKELYGEEVINLENQKQVEKERKKHKNKRFNIREGWLPLD